MTIPQVVDGVTDADAAFMNQLVDAANQANAAFNGAGQITTAAITPALGAYEPLQNMRAGYLNALDYGTTQADIQTAIDDAEIMAASTGRRVDVRLPAREWTWEGTTGLWIDQSHVHLVGDPGTVIYAPNMPQQVAPVRFQGGFTSDLTAGTANAAIGDTTITVSSASGLSAGDVIVIRNDENFNPDRTTYTKGEFAVILSVVSNTLTLASPLRDSYDHTNYPIAIDKMVPIENVGIHNIEIIAGGGQGQHCLQVRFCRGVTLGNLTLREGRYAGVELRKCLDVDILNVHPKDIVGSSVTSDPGHGIRIVGCERVLVHGTRGENNIHTVDCDQLTDDPVCRDITYRDISASNDTASGVSTHGGSDGVLMDGIRTFHCGGGIISRGKNTTIRNFAINGVHARTGSYLYGLYLGDGSPHPVGNGLAGTGLTVDNGYIDLGGVADYALYSTAPLVDATIRRLQLKGAKSNIALINGYHHRRSLIEDILMDGSFQSGSVGDAKHGLIVRPYTSGDGYNQSDLVIRHIRSHNILGSIVRVEGNSASGSNISQDIAISDVRGSGTYNRVVDLNSYFGRVSVELDQLASWTNAVVYDSSKVDSLTVRARGKGSPEGVLACPPGSLWQRTDGGANTCLYAKEANHNGTGWVGK